jgi:glycosyltransferase involved in cell wall biosynthesis
MKMLVSAPFDACADAGIALYVRRVIPHLARRCDLTILTPNPLLFSRYGRIVGVRNSVKYPARRVLWVLTRLAAHCRGDYDVLLCLTPTVAVPHVIPTIAVVHDLTPLAARRHNPIKEKASFLVGLQSLRLADHVVTDSRCTKNDLAAMNLLPQQRTTVGFCGPGITVSHAEEDYAKQFTPYVLYVGSHAPHKNVIRLICAFARVRTEQRLRLVLVGSGSEEQLLRAHVAIARQGLQDRVTLLHELSDEKLSSLYQHCRLLACPSLYEGFGLPVLEGMSHGAPVACSSVSSLPEVAGDAAVLFDPLSIPDMTKKLQTLLDDSGLATRLGEAGRHRATLFTWEKTALTIYEHARSLAGCPDRGG